MKLLTKAVLERFAKAPIGSTDGKPANEIPVLVKFFMPTGRYTFYVTEAGEAVEDGDWLLFGWCVSPLGADCDELGYSSFNEIAAVKGRFGLGMERDMHFDGKTLADVLPAGHSMLKPDEDNEAIATQESNKAGD